MLNGLSLFSGIGGIDVALSEWIRPVAYCEIDPYCQAVLLSNICNGQLFQAPIWDDIRSLRSSDFNGLNIDIIYGGFPCQDISVAGHGKGLAGERSGLFFEVVRLCRSLKPRFIFLENVPAITCRGGMEVVREITALGYDVRWCIISAASVGASHKRERWFLLANTWHDGSPSDTRGRRPREKPTQGKQFEPSEMFESLKRASSLSADVADSERERLEGHENAGQPQIPESRNEDPFADAGRWREIVSSMGKCSNGIPYHVDRLRSLGNAVVPIQAKEAFKILMGINQ